MESKSSKVVRMKWRGILRDRLLKRERRIYFLCHEVSEYVAAYLSKRANLNMVIFSDGWKITVLRQF